MSVFFPDKSAFINMTFQFRSLKLTDVVKAQADMSQGSFIRYILNKWMSVADIFIYVIIFVSCFVKTMH